MPKKDIEELSPPSVVKLKKGSVVIIVDKDKTVKKVKV